MCMAKDIRSLLNPTPPPCAFIPTAGFAAMKTEVIVDGMDHIQHGDAIEEVGETEDRLRACRTHSSPS